MEIEKKRVPQVVDKIGRPLDRILITPLFGNEYEFVDVEAVIDFINKVPEETDKMKMGLKIFEIKLYFFEDHPDNRVAFKDKKTAIGFFKLLFECGERAGTAK